MCAIGVVWHLLKRDQPRPAKWLFYAAVAYWVAGLLVNS